MTASEPLLLVRPTFKSAARVPVPGLWGSRNRHKRMYRGPAETVWSENPKNRLTTIEREAVRHALYPDREVKWKASDNRSKREAT